MGNRGQRWRRDVHENVEEWGWPVGASGLGLLTTWWACYEEGGHAGRVAVRLQVAAGVSGLCARGCARCWRGRCRVAPMCARALLGRSVSRSSLGARWTQHVYGADQSFCVMPEEIGMHVGHARSHSAAQAPTNIVSCLYSITTTSSTSPWSACNTDATFAQRMTLSRVSSSVGFSSCFQYVNVSMVPRCIQRRSSPSATAACFVSCTREQTRRRGTEREAAARAPAMVASHGVRCWTRSTV